MFYVHDQIQQTSVNEAQATNINITMRVMAFGL